jgi:diadenosine tetraphosphate (Ap4A) HIT family hydrolase
MSKNKTVLLSECPLCYPKGKQVLWENRALRIIRIEEPGYPGYCRIIWNTHVPSMLGLSPDQSAHCLSIVMATARVLDRLLSPKQVNIASLGNKVAHLHWHVLARFENDPHFPEAVWGPALKPPSSALPTLCTNTLISALEAELGPPNPPRNLA